MTGQGICILLIRLFRCLWRVPYKECHPTFILNKRQFLKCKVSCMCRFEGGHAAPILLLPLASVLMVKSKGEDCGVRSPRSVAVQSMDGHHVCIITGIISTL